jgi:hypothetical protein
MRWQPGPTRLSRARDGFVELVPETSENEESEFSRNFPEESAEEDVLSHDQTTENEESELPDISFPKRRSRSHPSAPARDDARGARGVSLKKARAARDGCEAVSAWQGVGFRVGSPKKTC